MAVTQWNPTHRVTCKIRGWEPFVFSTWHDLDQKFSLLKVFLKPHHYFDYGIQGGSFDLRTYTLDQFYKKHLLGWNTWSRSNEGYDLARYFGTTWTFYPHAHQAYLVFWERNWETTEFEQLPKMHPAWLMTHHRNVRMVLPRSWRGRKVRIRIKPPSLQTSQWWYASSWIAIALFRIGVTPINLEDPFVHKAGNTQPIYAPMIGWAQAPTQNQKGPLPVKWHYASFQMSNYVAINYRWWWDTGEDNYILINSVQNDPTNAPNVMLQVIPVHYPYYVFLYGAMLPTGRDYVKTNTDLPTKNPVLQGKINPSPLAIWWYYDRAAFYGPDEKTYQIDTRYLRPEDLPTQGRTWVYLYSESPFGSGVVFDNDTNLKTGWTTTQIAPMIQRIVQNSPFVMGMYDIPFQQRQFNVTARYTSVWQWGGIIPHLDTVRDPEGLVAGEKPPQSSVRNPATVGYANIHPWDLTQGGTINEHKLRLMLSDILTPTGPARPECSRPASPSPRPSRSPPRRRPRRPRRKRPRSPTPSESEESEGLSSSGTSGSPSESLSSSEEETAPPTKTPRVVLRRHLLLKR